MQCSAVLCRHTPNTVACVRLESSTGGEDSAAFCGQRGTPFTATCSMPGWRTAGCITTGHCRPALQVYERAISNVPPAPEKRYWQRYIYLWIKYALFEELEAGEWQTKGHWRVSGCAAECAASSWLV